MQILLHPGFHKTGTSSLQACLAANRTLLAPYARIVLQDELDEPLRHATRFAVAGDPFDLAGFTASFARVCQSRAAEGSETVVISCEGLSGRTPGKRGVMDYAAAVPLAGAMHDAVRAVFGRKVDLTFIYTTRSAESWLASAWRHNLWGYRITEDLPAFRNRYAAAAEFSRILASIAKARSNLQLKSFALEELQCMPMGPADALLRHLALPDDLRVRLQNPGWRNRGWSEADARECLALNRSDLPDDEVKARKRAMRRPL